METKKPIYFFRHEPNGKVTYWMDGGSFKTTVSADSFATIREHDTIRFWVEHKPDDIGHSFETETGFRFQLLKGKP
ncbi:MAG: hypothetical protein KIT51_07800 [Cyclobacteriaceae bacterium]|nr:MAG: hypothetical protein KIT51_07800 [Cyclobacteriaceae bacterium]